MNDQKELEQDQQTELLEEVATAGAILRNARENKGLSIDAVAIALNLRPQVLENIENDNFGDDSSTTYMRGYIRNYAKHIEADLAAITSCLDQQLPESTPPTMQSFSRKTKRQARDSQVKWFGYVIALVLLGLMVTWWVQKDDKFAVNDFSQPSIEEIEAEKTAIRQSPEQELVAQIVAEQADTPVEVGSGDTLALSAEQTESTQLIASATERAAPSAEQLSASNDAANTNAASRDTDNRNTDVANNAVAEVTPAAVADQNVVGAASIGFTLTGDSWINVTDANGKVIVDGVKSSAREVKANGVSPLKVIIGAPQFVTMTFNDQAVDLSGYREGQVARLTLPQSR
ncbi:DUF4115 domain-containing protein [Shewanella sp. WXL01]|uniref:RodZ domain-containing protein n=1 Tax=Shewanella sp. WXL01 TaxID=2709721 RepID=UPI00143868BC|nr:RodZ domain-containing protein [Shewanella sp. WXL01]NKF50003.1 DUF4115 domain-containing protein [Shewanella sp. WXL01]